MVGYCGGGSRGNNIEDAERVIEEVVIAGRECGLDITKEKCRIIIFNMKEKPREIAGIKVWDRMKYLGVTINDSRKLFRVHKTLMMEKANKMANITHSVIARSCSKLLIGKVYWKSIALPGILYGANIIDFTKEEIKQLQRIENSVGRKILGAPGYAQEAAIRGEIGISSMKSRIMEGQIKYAQYVIRGEGNAVLERVVDEMISQGRKNRWIKGLIEDRHKVGLRGRPINVSEKEISEKIKEWDTNMWRNEMQEMTSLTLYRKWRVKLGGQEEIYDNRIASVIVFKCRSNNLNLGDRKRFQNQPTECIMCQNNYEDLNHFVLQCPAYEEERRKNPVLQRPYPQDEDQVIGELIFNNSRIEETKSTLNSFWRTREIRRKELQN